MPKRDTAIHTSANPSLLSIGHTHLSDLACDSSTSSWQLALRCPSMGNRASGIVGSAYWMEIVIQVNSSLAVQVGTETGVMHC